MVLHQPEVIGGLVPKNQSINPWLSSNQSRELLSPRWATVSAPKKSSTLVHREPKAGNSTGRFTTCPLLNRKQAVLRYGRSPQLEIAIQHSCPGKRG